MLQLFISQCDGVARLIAAACANAAIPSVLAVAVAFLVTRLKIWNSATRYWAWWLTLTFLVLLPALLVAFRPAAQTSQTFVPDPAVHIQSVRNSAAPGIEGLTLSHSVPAVSPKSLPPLPALLFLLYCGFVLWRLSRLALGFLSGLQLKRGAEVLPDASERLAALIRTLRVRRSVSLATSSQISAPVAIGYRAPWILLPRKLLGQLDDAEMEQVIAHELAHISRYDDWWIAVQKLVQSIFVFHPLVQLISRRIDLDREMACDDHVISSYQPREYAACLTKIAELAEFGAATPLTVPLLARKSHLASRVEMMLDRTRAHIPAISARRLAMFAMFGLLAACVSLRAPAILAFPALSYSYAAWMPKVALTNVQAAPAPRQPAEPSSSRVAVAPVPAAAPPQPATPSSPPPVPARQSATESGGIDSIAVTSENGASTAFEENGSERTSHSPFPRGTIVFERNGNSYIIRDRSTVAAARELLKPQEQLSEQQEVLGRQQEKLSQVQEQLGRQQEAISNRGLDHATASDLEKQLRNLEAKIRSIDLEKNVKTASDAQEQISQLQSMLGDIQSRMGEQQSKAGDEQGKLGEQQSRLGEQQSRLGDQQSELGERQEREARRAEQKLRDLIRSAEAKGLAKPLE